MINLFDKGIRRGSRIHPKLLQAAIQLDLNVLECQDFIREHPQVKTACWAYDKYLKRHYLFVGSEFIKKYSVNSLMFVLKHEILHKALYRDLVLPDPLLTNTVLDILINKVLSISHPKEARAFSKETLPAEKDNALLLVRCDITNKEILELENKIPHIVGLWKEIYGYPTLTPEIPSPIDIYFKINRPNVRKEIIKDWERYPLSDEDLDELKETTQKADTDRFWKKIEKKTVNRMKDESLRRDSVSYSTQMSNFFEELYIEPESVNVQEIKKRLSSIVTSEQLDAVVTAIELECGVDNTNDWFPFNLSEKGIIDIAIGFTNVIPIYNNVTPLNSQPNMGFYLDTSPSMDPFREYSQFLVQSLADLFPVDINAFAGSVKKIKMEHILNGAYEMGISTSYDAVVENFLSSEENLEVMVIVTDGMSDLRNENIIKFKEKGKRCYVIYFERKNNEPIESNLEMIAEKIFRISI